MFTCVIDFIRFQVQLVYKITTDVGRSSALATYLFLSENIKKIRETGVGL